MDSGERRRQVAREVAGSVFSAGLFCLAKGRLWVYISINETGGRNKEESLRAYSRKINEEVNL